MSDLSTELLFELKLFQADLGVGAANNLEKACQELLDYEKNDLAQRISLSNNIKLWSMMTTDDVRIEPLVAHNKLLTEVVKKTLLLPNDDETNDYPDGKGEQFVAVNILEMINFIFMVAPTFANRDLWGQWVNILEDVVDVDIVDSTPLKSEGAAITRSDSFGYLLGLSAPYGSNVKPPDNYVDSICLYCSAKYNHPKSIIDKVTGAIQTQSATNPDLLKHHARAIFAMISAGQKDMVHSLQPALYQEDPEAFHDNLDIIFKQDFLTSSSLLHAIAQKNGDQLLGHIDHFYDLFMKGVQYQMESMILQIFNGIASKNPVEVAKKIVGDEEFFERCLTLANCDTSYAMVLGSCGNYDPQKESTLSEKQKLEAQETRANTLKDCLKFLDDPRLTTHCPAILVNAIYNILVSLTSVYKTEEERKSFVKETSLSEPDKLERYHAYSSSLVEKIEDWIACRSLKGLDDKIKNMNDGVKNSCSNFEDVKKYVDQHIADLKDFVGEVAKKLPQPYRMTIKNGLRKKLILHFKCPKSGVEVTVETKDWNKWLKAGFGLIKLGKCAAEMADGNFLAVTKGIDAVAEIYSIFKEKDDEDFKSFITQPFLTSAEQDKLIIQLRSQKFFETMTYDSQLAAWVCIEHLEGDMKTKFLLEQEKLETKLADPNLVTKEKGKNLGFGSARDAVNTAASLVHSGVADFGDEEGHEFELIGKSSKAKIIPSGVSRNVDPADNGAANGATEGAADGAGTDSSGNRGGVVAENQENGKDGKNKKEKKKGGLFKSKDKSEKSSSPAASKKEQSKISKSNTDWEAQVKTLQNQATLDRSRIAALEQELDLIKKHLGL